MPMPVDEHEALSSEELLEKYMLGISLEELQHICGLNSN
jgi:hypothetical protein